MSVPELTTGPVSVEQAGELLTVRRAAFVTQAQELDDPHLPVLTETLDDVIADLNAPNVVTVGAWLGARLVGAVRIELAAERATIDKFAVAPDLHGQGIGEQLLYGILPSLPDGIAEVWVASGVGDEAQSLADYADDDSPSTTASELAVNYLQKILANSALSNE